MDFDRRRMLTGSAGVGAIALAGLVAKPAASAASVIPTGRKLPSAPKGSADKVAHDEKYWKQVAKHFKMSDATVNFENGYFGANPTNVRTAYAQATARIQEENSWFMRREFGNQATAVRERIAAELGCSVDEIAVTRGATEALQAIIGGYNKLASGDAVAYADLDYDSMQYAMNWLRDRRGVEVIRTAIPSRPIASPSWTTTSDCSPITPRSSSCSSPMSRTAPGWSHRSLKSPRWPPHAALTP